jgi:hypothetical protein
LSLPLDNKDSAAVQQMQCVLDGINAVGSTNACTPSLLRRTSIGKQHVALAIFMSRDLVVLFEAYCCWLLGSPLLN